MFPVNALTDYPAIKKLAAALHKFDTSRHGAAIMIGAGFSRSAAHHVSGSKKMPLWDAFTSRLLAELDPSAKAPNFADPLRVAEEYRAYFGPAALNELVRVEIDDGTWIPGPLYPSLLKLPWSEIMTTNWDTLLERAAKDIDGPYYSFVTKVSDLASAPSPRIVKLHGTLGVTDSFIAAQEDYRKYPEKFAPFVNFARQVFIENELCLLGFSGDDPNFLQWSGWVRDHLTEHARKIYLVGALNLTAARRKYLESINISPIDLWETVKHIDDSDARHRSAIEVFLRAMEEEGNSRLHAHQWCPSNLVLKRAPMDDFTRQHTDHAYAASLLTDQLESLQRDRETYPGWLVCPIAVHWNLKAQLSHPYPNSNNLAVMNAEDRAKLLYEIAWRRGITFDYIAPWLAEALIQVADPDYPCILKIRQQLEIALELLKSSRRMAHADKIGQLTLSDYRQKLKGILRKNAFYLPDCDAELAYLEALEARDHLDLDRLEGAIDNIAGEDLVWKLRKAALLMELGRFGDGTSLLAKAYGELRECHRCDRHSIPILSRLTWAHLLLNAAQRGSFNSPLEELPAYAEHTYRKWKCDPRAWIDYLQQKADDEYERYNKSRNPVIPLFDQGSYRDNTSNHSSRSDISEILLLEGITRHIGLPLRTGSTSINVNLLAGVAERLLLSRGRAIEISDYVLAIRAAATETSSSIESVFSRIGLACSHSGVVDTLIQQVLKAITYWRKKQTGRSGDQGRNSVSALRVLIEVAARLMVRANPEQAKNAFCLGLELGKEFALQDLWLYDALDHLLEYSLKSIPKRAQSELLADSLAFPLPNEIPESIPARWPNPVIRHVAKRSTYPDITTQINKLIETVKHTDAVASTAAIERLLPLVLADNFLTHQEYEKLARALWHQTGDDLSLPHINLYPHALLLLPTPDRKATESLLRAHLYDHDEQVLRDAQSKQTQYPSPSVRRATTLYHSIGQAAADQRINFRPTEQQALVHFSRLTTWKPSKTDDNDDFLGVDQQQMGNSAGYALSYAIVPSLPREAITVEQFEQLMLFYAHTPKAYSTLVALIYFANLNSSIADSVEQTIRKALHGQHSTEVLYAASATLEWAKIVTTNTLPSVNRLISRLVTIIESGRTLGLHQVIWVAGELLSKHLLSDEQIMTLAEAIPNAFDAANYAEVAEDSYEAITASSIREVCTTVAKRFAELCPDNCRLEEMLEKAKNDPLPEVRFAFEQS